MKKLNLTKMLSLVSCVLLFALSCKKDPASEKENLLNDAKQWYLESTASAKTALRASNEKSENVTTAFLWDTAKLYEFSDGKEVVGVPVTVALSNKKDAPGSYMLMVYKEEGHFNSLIIFNEKSSYFKTNNSSTEIEAAFIVGKKNNALRSLAKSKRETLTGAKGKVMVREAAPPVCTDWYWTTYAYDSYGNVIEVISEVYLYTTCTEEGGGGGGELTPDEDPEPEIEWGEPDDTDLTQVNSTSSDTTGSIIAGWYCYKAHGGVIHFKSYEKIHYKITRWSPGLNIVYKGYNLSHIDHISMASEGNISGQDITPIYAYYLDHTTTTIASIKLTFKDRREYVQKGTTRIKYSPDITASKTWTKAQLSLVDN